MKIRINSIGTYPPSSNTFVFNNKSYTSLKVPYQPIFGHSSQIVLSANNSKVMESLLSVISEPDTSVDI